MARLGGLVGSGTDTNISHSYVADSSIFGDKANAVNAFAGGLMGYGTAVNIRQSWTAGVSLLAALNIGGLMGGADSTDIRHSYVTAGSIAGARTVGGLIGNGNSATGIRYSYATGGSITASFERGGLSAISGISVDASYWDKDTTGLSTSGGGGQGNTTEELQMPTDFAGSLYEVWGNFGATRTRARKCKVLPNRPASSPSGILARTRNTRP